MTAALFPARRRDALRRRLGEWYTRHARDLPWRRTSDPYLIWLSEAMLQQTRVETVIPYYERFRERFPTVEALAGADEQDVLREWAGLGYYARARNLKRAAVQIVERHAGRFPDDAEAIAALPGVGRYTAGAVLSIAFGRPAPIVDGNVKRVVSRWLAAPALDEAAFWQAARELVPDEAPGDFNQALMELGATVCLSTSPMCLTCPVRPVCGAAKLGRPTDFPVRRPRKAPTPVTAAGGLLRRGNRVLMFRRPSRGLLGGMWEIPNVGGDGIEDLIDCVRERSGLRAKVDRELGRVRHTFTHRDLTLTVLALEIEGGRFASRLGDARFCSPADLGDLPLSKLTRKALALG